LKKIKRGGSMLVYVSKESIYNTNIEVEFKKYISICRFITDPNALKIIDELKIYRCRR
jgi:hypothetical protein